MRSIRKSFRWAFFTSMALSPIWLPVPCSLASESPKQVIFWRDAAHTQAMFIPEAVLHATKIEALPLSAEDKRTLERSLSGSQTSLLTTCQVPHGLGSGADETFSYVEIVQRAQLAFIGSVTAAVDGWSSRELGALRMVHVEIEEVLNDVSASLWSGQAVAFRGQGGRISAHGATLCTEVPVGFRQFDKGDRVLVTADPYAADDRYVDPRLVFPILDDAVQPRPYPELGTTAAFPLADLRLSIAAAKGDK